MPLLIGLLLVKARSIMNAGALEAFTAEGAGAAFTSLSPATLRKPGAKKARAEKYRFILMFDFLAMVKLRPMRLLGDQIVTVSL